MGILTLLRNAFGRSRKARPTEAEGAPAPANPTPASEPSSPTVPEPRNEHDLVAAAFDNITVPSPTRPTDPEEKQPATPTEPTPEPTHELKPEVEAEPEAEAEREAEAEQKPEPQVEAEPEAEREAAAEQKAEPEAEAELNPEPEPEREAAAEQKAEPELKTEVEAEQEAEAAPEGEPQAEATETTEPVAVPEAEATPRTKLEAEPQPEAESGLEADEPEADELKADATEPEAQAEPEQKPEAEAQAEPEQKPEPEQQAQAEPEQVQGPESPAQPEPAPEPIVAAADGEDAPQGPPAPDDETRTGGAGGKTTEAEGAAEAEGPALPPTLTTAYDAAATALAAADLTGTRAKVYLVLDRSASMRPYYKDGSAQALAEQTLALAAHLDPAPDPAVKVVFFSTEVDGTGDLTLTDHENKIDTLHAQLGRMGRTSYHAAVQEVLALHDKTRAPKKTPALVIFQTDGAPDAKTPATQALTEAAKTHPSVFFSFVAFGAPDNKAFDYLRKLKTGNTSYFLAGEEPRELTDKELYDGVLAGWRP
ncbi:VWA domain-containing protein [Streptomyces sp. NPDC052013]|uniref:VWA domain-containing protein n=1 Tax=Streptomyces sp. NPDC052013 TaxID=3365679 RepID=UPI0037D00254